MVSHIPPCFPYTSEHLAEISSIKRDISHLCRDASPHTVRGKHTEEPEDLPPQQSQQDIKPIIPLTSSSSSSSHTHSQSHSQSQSHNHLPPQLYGDPNFPPAWPLLPGSDTNTGATFVDGTVGNGLGMPKGSGEGDSWGANDESELGALSYVLLFPHTFRIT